jgi:hypothetical protein
MLPIMSAGAILTILVVMAFATFFLCAATWDALVDLITQLKEYFNEQA